MSGKEWLRRYRPEPHAESCAADQHRRRLSFASACMRRASFRPYAHSGV